MEHYKMDYNSYIGLKYLVNTIINKRIKQNDVYHRELTNNGLLTVQEQKMYKQIVSTYKKLKTRLNKDQYDQDVLIKFITKNQILIDAIEAQHAGIDTADLARLYKKIGDDLISDFLNQKTQSQEA